MEEIGKSVIKYIYIEKRQKIYYKINLHSKSYIYMLEKNKIRQQVPVEKEKSVVNNVSIVDRKRK